MFNRSQIMQTAWARYRQWYGNQPFRRDCFAYCLKVAWQAAKREQMDPKAIRAAAIRQEIERLPFKPLRVNIDRCRTQLEAELARLAA